MVSPVLHSRVARPLCIVLTAAQILAGVPAQTFGQSPATEAAEQTVTVNTKTPTVVAAPLSPVFSADPTDRELTRARVFDEPLIPDGTNPGGTENLALATALTQYLSGGGRDHVLPVLQFLSTFPDSRWRASLMTNLGIVYRRTGYFSRALSAWEDAWARTRYATDPGIKATADRAIGELFELNARLGRFDVLEQLFEQIDGRDVRGSATEKISGARQALWLMHNRTEEAFRCGPLAIEQVLRFGNDKFDPPEAIRMCKSTKNGTSLAQLDALADAIGRPMRMAKRAPGAPVVTPAVVHWKVGHFAALVQAGEDRYLVRDPTFGDEFWVTRAALDEEASGYFLIPDTSLITGWMPVDEEKGSQVWGKGMPTGVDPTDNDDDRECPEGCEGMAVASIHMMLISIKLKDIPLAYVPPAGPPVQFRLTYNQRETFQPHTFYYGNVGPKWTFDWFAFVEDDPSNAAAAVTVYHRNGGRETSTGYDSATQSYAPTIRKQAVVVRTSTSPIAYERRMPDGSVEVFSQPDGAQTFPRKVFLTALKDPHGNALTFTWDAQLRLVAATDTIGQVTTISYEHADPLKITKVTDPFGRVARFEYDTAGRLQRITDVIGLQSSFTYGTADIVKALTTPYGTTTFTTGEAGVIRWAEMTDPLGGKERVQYGGGLVYSEPANVLPAGMTVKNVNINHHNTLYWDKRAMALAPGELWSATDYNWALNANGAYQAVAVPLSIKKPLEVRTWYLYQGGGVDREGTVRRASAIGRVLDDGTSQVTKYEFNSRGHMTKRVDPLGRETVYEYDSSGLDLLRVKQKNGATYDLLESRTYNGLHEPLTVTDAAGQSATYTYNARGQMQTVTNAKNETTTYSYDTATARLTSVTGPVSGALITFTYDAYGRVRTTTDRDAYTVTTDYDALNRPTRTTYPDGTYEEITYQYLNPLQQRDRLGRVTRYNYDATRRLTSTRDALGRTATQEWCTCGNLEALVDGNGNRTRWERDLQGRITREIRANGSGTQYAYEVRSNRLRTVTDAKNQVTTYTYAPDDQVTSITYTNEQIATPDVAFSYDTIYGRLASMVDGTGTTTYTYHAVTTSPTLGATQLASADGPLTDDTITYSYDQLGRVTMRTVNGVGVTWGFDGLGRVTSTINVLGTFTYTYEAQTSRLATVTYPNGQSSTYTYYGNTGDRRLQTIHHRYPDATTLSKFEYTYDVGGNILTWRQQTDTTTVLFEYGYDNADQLVSAFKKSDDPTPVLLKRYAYAYDRAGNRTSEQVDDTLIGAAHNNMNQLISQQPSGALRFEGTLNEPATVTIAGKLASVSPTNAFDGFAPVVAGTNTVDITATDGSGNAVTKTYQVDSTGAARTFTHDADGNMSSDGTRTFDWDAANRLVSVRQGTTVLASFAYDGRGRRSSKSAAGVTTSYIYDGNELLEQRSAGGTTRYFYREGIDDLVARQEPSAAFYYVRDHIENVRRITTTSGAVVTTLDYDPWGKAPAASPSSTMGFTGREWDAETHLYYFRARYVDPSLGRFLTEDPARDRIPNSLYAYAGNNPVNRIDPLGLNDRPWPFNGRVANTSGCKCPVPAIDMDSNTIYCVAPGTSTPRFTVDVDFVLVQGTWRKIGPWTFDVTKDCGPDDGFDPATSGEVTDIEGKLKQQGKDPKKPCG